MVIAVGAAPEAACHELLLRLAGRLPDRQLWRFRDWLAAGAYPALGRTLPLTLLRERIGLTAREIALLDAAAVPFGADPGLLNAVFEADEPSESDHSFAPEPGTAAPMGDQVGVVLTALLRGRPEVAEVRQCWRASASGGPASRRVVLIAVTESAARLTGEVQRVLRALGEREPAVEVIPPGMSPSPYHRAALAASEPVYAPVDAGVQLVAS
jgi:hypothetical protein